MAQGEQTWDPCLHAALHWPAGLLVRLRQSAWYTLGQPAFLQETSCPPSPQLKHSSSLSFITSACDLRFICGLLFSFLDFSSLRAGWLCGKDKALRRGSVCGKAILSLQKRFSLPELTTRLHTGLLPLLSSFLPSTTCRWCLRAPCTLTFTPRSTPWPCFCVPSCMLALNTAAPSQHNCFTLMIFLLQICPCTDSSRYTRAHSQHPATPLQLLILSALMAPDIFLLSQEA